jgi:hypothetical protein
MTYQPYVGQIVDPVAYNPATFCMICCSPLLFPARTPSIGLTGGGAL